MLRRLLHLLLLFAIILFSVTSCRDKKDLVSQESQDPKIAKLKMPNGFKAERIYSPGENEQGSWVSMTFDNKGRMIACDQFGVMYRLTIPPVGDSSKPKVEKLVIGNPDPSDSAANRFGMGYAQGLLYAFNSLYVSVNHDSDAEFKKQSGLYRLQDKDGDDQYENVEQQKEMKGEGEQGPHSTARDFDPIASFLFYTNPRIHAVITMKK